MNMIKCTYIVHNTGISLLLSTESVGERLDRRTLWRKKVS